MKYAKEKKKLSNCSIEKPNIYEKIDNKLDRTGIIHNIEYLHLIVKIILRKRKKQTCIFCCCIRLVPLSVK